MEQFFLIMAFLTALFGLLKAAIELYGALRDHEGSEGGPGRRNGCAWPSGRAVRGPRRRT